MVTVTSPLVIEPWCAVGSPMRAAAFPPIVTVLLPMLMLSGGPAQVQGVPTTAAGFPPIFTVGTPGGFIGPPVCGLLSGFNIGQTCVSPTLAAAGI